MTKFEISENGMCDGDHIVGDVDCPGCDSNIVGWRDEGKITSYPIPCDLCKKGLMHGEEGYCDDGYGGVVFTVFYLCDACKEF